jgi:hypothetical protein
MEVAKLVATAVKSLGVSPDPYPSLDLAAPDAARPSE